MFSELYVLIYILYFIKLYIVEQYSNMYTGVFYCKMGKIDEENLEYITTVRSLRDYTDLYDTFLSKASDMELSYVELYGILEDLKFMVRAYQDDESSASGVSE